MEDLFGCCVWKALKVPNSEGRFGVAGGREGERRERNMIDTSCSGSRYP